MGYGVIIPIILGVVFTIVGYIKRKEIQKLKQSGIRVDGTVISLDYEPPTNSGSSDGYFNNTGSYFPVIRYVTTEKELLTKRCEIGHYPAKYNEGDTVPILYDPDNANEFIIDDNSSIILIHLFWLGVLLIAVGCAIFAVTK